MILSIAATTTYSVVVDRVLDVRTVLRMAAQYWLATIVARRSPPSRSFSSGARSTAAGASR